MPRPKRPDLKPQLSNYRQRAGLTQQDVADRLGTTPEMIRRHERGSARPSTIYRLKYCALYGATENQLGLETPIVNSDELILIGDEPTSLVAVPSGGMEDPLEIFARIHRLGGIPVDDEIVNGIQSSIGQITNDYEARDKRSLASELVRQRQWIEKLTQESRHPRQRQALYRLASQTSGILGYMAVNQGKFAVARAYCVEAFQLGDYGGSSDLQAWARGTQSFCEFYAGDFVAARDLALIIRGSGTRSYWLSVVDLHLLFWLGGRGWCGDCRVAGRRFQGPGVVSWVVGWSLGRVSLWVRLVRGG